MAIRPTTTQAAILVAQNHPLVVDTIELPTTLEVGQVLVELRAVASADLNSVKLMG